MPVIIDVREKDEWMKTQADEIALLDDIEQGVDEGTKYSYDICVVTLPRNTHGDHRAQRVLKFERKRWPDFFQSWLDGKLERQVSGVDALIVEFDPLELMEMAPSQRGDEAEYAYIKRRAAFYQNQQSAFKHLAKLSANMWVIHSLGPECTMAIMRYLEREGHDLTIKPNKVKVLASHPLLRVLDAVGQVNMHRKLPDGSLVGEKIAPLVDIDGLIASLRIDEWMKLDLAQGEKGRKNIGPGTALRIAAGLRASLTKEDSPSTTTSTETPATSADSTSTTETSADRAPN